MYTLETYVEHKVQFIEEKRSNEPTCRYATTTWDNVLLSLAQTSFCIAKLQLARRDLINMADKNQQIVIVE